MQNDKFKNQRIDHNVIKSYDELLKDEYTKTLDAIIDGETDYPHNGLSKNIENSIVSSHYSKPSHSYKKTGKLTLTETELETKTNRDEPSEDVAQKFIDRTQFPLG